MSIKLFPVLCNEKNMANYAYILNDTQSKQTLIIDAAEPDPIISKLEELNLTPSYILTTHHHFDHVGANETLKQKYNLQIIAPEKEFSKIPAADTAARDGETIYIGSLEITPISAAGHTNGHLLYYIPKEKMLFTGDVLFNCCIGGLFEGTPQEMFESLLAPASRRKLLTNRHFSPICKKCLTANKAAQPQPHLPKKNSLTPIFRQIHYQNF